MSLSSNDGHEQEKPAQKTKQLFAIKEMIRKVSATSATAMPLAER